MNVLVNTSSNKGDTVLDITMGGGSTGCSCITNHRNFIGIEIDENYFNIAKSRLDSYQSMMPKD